MRLVSDVMTREPVLLPDNLTVWDALQRMVEAGVSQMPVVNTQNRLVGALTWETSCASTACPTLRPIRWYGGPVWHSL